MVELKVPQLPPEMALEQGMTSMGTMAAMVIQSIVDSRGSAEAQKMIYPRLKEMGKQMAAMAPQMGLTGKDAIAIASFIHVFEKQMIKVTGEPTVVGPDRVVKEITKCPFQNMPPDFCLAFQAVADGAIEAINPAYKWTITKMIPRKDQTCQWAVERK